ncbi:uncharacterized protein Bfra_009904 [Botrytis fragariae]|uniref:Uncharacterized protein n=1 Tax=Botrytis fragariae TaxID=1964551 RepID=A0A8H6ANA5_9HELO|nr:uncharacterized protein Bfra_009904 [Botrytis fragariae]KAF5870516.1 hypothetical protein Bfra_009904 [Botrytis fragariae]
MDLTSSSYMASLSPTPSSLIHSSASLPAAFSSPQNSTTLFGISSFLKLVSSRYEVYKLQKKVSRLRFETMNDRMEQLRNNELKLRTTLFEDHFQQDASELVQIRDLQNSTIVFDREAMNHFAVDFAAAQREAYEVSR